MLSEVYRAEAARIVEIVSWAYARRCWWADQKEIAQQAWTVCMEVHAQQTEWEVYAYGTVCYVACMRQLSRWLYREQLVVSAGDHDVKNASAEVKRNSVHMLPHLEASQFGAHKQLSIAHLRHRIRHRLFQLLGRQPGVEASALVMLDGYPPREVAEGLGIEVGEIYRWNEAVAGVSRADNTIRKLAAELAAERDWS